MSNSSILTFVKVKLALTFPKNQFLVILVEPAYLLVVSLQPMYQEKEED